MSGLLLCWGVFCCAVVVQSGVVVFCCRAVYVIGVVLVMSCFVALFTLVVWCCFDINVGLAEHNPYPLQSFLLGRGMSRYGMSRCFCCFLSCLFK